MPYTDYSKTVIYKIKCKDPQVKYSEIGATTNLKCVRYRFRKAYLEANDTRLKQEITASGGIDNWEIVVLESYQDCKSKADSNTRVDAWKNGRYDLSISSPKPSKMLQNAPTHSIMMIIIIIVDIVTVTTAQKVIMRNIY